MDMILKNNIFEDIQKNIPQHLYNRLVNRRRRVIEEDKKIRKNFIKKLCEVNIDDDMNGIVKGIKPLLRKKRRVILLMRENYYQPFYPPFLKFKYPG